MMTLRPSGLLRGWVSQRHSPTIAKAFGLDAAARPVSDVTPF